MYVLFLQTPNKFLHNPNPLMSSFPNSGELVSLVFSRCNGLNAKAEKMSIKNNTPRDINVDLTPKCDKTIGNTMDITTENKELPQLTKPLAKPIRRSKYTAKIISDGLYRKPIPIPSIKPNVI